MILETKGLACGYADRAVLDSLDLAFLPGTVTALLGPNGSGKSTLLKTLCRSLKPLGGSISVDGVDLRDLPIGDLARLIAVVPQEEHFAFHFTVRQVVIMGRLPYSDGLLDTPHDHDVANAAMEEADCLDLAHRHVTELSGGERQRVLIARALAQKTQILLLDEPSAHLDVAHQVSLAKRLALFAESGGIAIAAIHDLNLAGFFADHAILLNGGRAALVASIGETLNSPVLDEVYGVCFDRIRTAEGRTLVVTGQ